VAARVRPSRVLASCQQPVCARGQDNLTDWRGRLDLVYLRIGKMEVPHGEPIRRALEVLAALRDRV